MVAGSIKKIDLSTSSFERIITEGNLYVDKTKVIEHFLETPSTVQLVARQRRLGKSLNMDTIRCFLTDMVDLRHLFKGLYIESSPVWAKANSAPVFYFDFKQLRLDFYKEQIIDQVDKHIYSIIDPDNLNGRLKRKYELIIKNISNATESLLFLLELTHEVVGKRSYLLIDEYDKLLVENYKSAEYEEIRAFETALLSSALKGNPHLEKALLTGVMRISHESMLSGLNNIVTFDIFRDDVYTTDYGLTDDEVEELCQLSDFNIKEAKDWYNGICIEGYAIYNIYAVMSFLTHKVYDCYWGKSGTLDMIIDLLNDRRKLVLIKLLSGEQIELDVDNRISLKQLDNQVGDESFYSLLVQAGYLALNERNPLGVSKVSIPNRELMIVWKNFILSRFYNNPSQVRTLFDNIDNLVAFSKDLEYFLSDRLSYHDLSVYRNENLERVHERAYHIYILGLLSAYENMSFRHPLSNKESGDGRYDILVESMDGYYIFELKTCGKNEDLGEQSKQALNQIETKRYGADLELSKKRLIKIGIAICGKLCRVACG